MADWFRWRYSCLVIIQFLQHLKTVGFVSDSPLYLNLRCAHIMITKIDETLVFLKERVTIIKKEKEGGTCRINV